MEYVEIALSLVFTAAVYCAFPLLFAFLRKSPIAKKKYMLLCIVVTASVAIVFQIFRIASDLSGSVCPCAPLGHRFLQCRSLYPPQAQNAFRHYPTSAAAGAGIIPHSRTRCLTRSLTCALFRSRKAYSPATYHGNVVHLPFLWLSPSHR